MPSSKHWWITVWFLLCVPVMCMECSYLFLRPRTLEGGDLHDYFKPLYGPYAKIDKTYGVEAFERGDGFPNAQSLLNAVETLISVYYIYLNHVAGNSAAPLFGFICAVMTFSKTILFLIQEYYCGWCSTGHNDPKDILWLWFMPALPWLVMPGFISYTLGKDIVQALRVDKSSALKKRN